MIDFKKLFAYTVLVYYLAFSAGEHKSNQMYLKVQKIKKEQTLEQVEWLSEGMIINQSWLEPCNVRIFRRIDNCQITVSETDIVSQLVVCFSNEGEDIVIEGEDIRNIEFRFLGVQGRGKRLYTLNHILYAHSPEEFYTERLALYSKGEVYNDIEKLMILIPCHEQISESINTRM